MAITTKTTKFLDLFREVSTPVMFMSGLFRSPRKNFFDTEEVALDVLRGGEDVAVVVQSLAQGYRMNENNIYTTKEFKPPVFKEAIALNSADLLKRTPGNDPFGDINFRAALTSQMLDGMVLNADKIRRSIELQASQVLQTGVLTLVDSTGATLYSLDYQPKSTHFPTVGTSWATATGEEMLNDLEALGELVRVDGKLAPNEILFGTTAYEKFFSNSVVRSRFDIRRLDQGTISSTPMRSDGGRFRGIVELGNYRYDVWTYDGRYDHPATGVSTPYLDPGKVIVRAAEGRLDMVFGSIPNIGQLVGGRKQLLPELPSRLSDGAGSMDLFTNVWIPADGEQIFGGVGARPLAIPTQIDSYGCLDTLL